MRIAPETIRMGAKRRVSETFDSNFNVWFFSYAPCGHFAYRHPSITVEGQNIEGTQLFFQPANWVTGDVVIQSKDVVDYAWLTLSEMKDYLDPALHATISPMLAY